MDEEVKTPKEAEAIFRRYVETLIAKYQDRHWLLRKHIETGDEHHAAVMRDCLRQMIVNADIFNC